MKGKEKEEIEGHESCHLSKVHASIWQSQDWTSVV